MDWRQPWKKGPKRSVFHYMLKSRRTECGRLSQLKLNKHRKANWGSTWTWWKMGRGMTTSTSLEEQLYYIEQSDRRWHTCMWRWAMSQMKTCKGCYILMEHRQRSLMQWNIWSVRYAHRSPHLWRPRRQLSRDRWPSTRGSWQIPSMFGMPRMRSLRWRMCWMHFLCIKLQWPWRIHQPTTPHNSFEIDG